MQNILLIVILLFLIPTWGSDLIDENSLVEVGDMIVPESSIVPDDYVSPRGFKQKKARLWPEGILPLSFSNKINQRERKEFIKFCAELGRYADIECVPRESQDRDYIYVNKTSKKYCGSSYVGRRGGKQTLLIRCWRKRTIQHELMHALGILHEHNRMDRDEHIQMLWQNMKSGSRRNYSKVSMASLSHYLTFYDYDSIMHYSSFQGSKNSKPVFYRIDKGPEKGVMKTQALTMSYGDHYILYGLYGGEVPKR